MPIRIPTKTIILQRNGKNFSPPVGKPFQFTAEELKEIDALNKTVLRKPINEEAELQGSDAKQPTPASNADAKQATAPAKTGGKTSGKTAADDL